MAEPTPAATPAAKPAAAAPAAPVPLKDLRNPKMKALFARVQEHQKRLGWSEVVARHASLDHRRSELLRRDPHGRAQDSRESARLERRRDELLVDHQEEVAAKCAEDLAARADSEDLVGAAALGLELKHMTDPPLSRRSAPPLR